MLKLIHSATISARVSLLGLGTVVSAVTPLGLLVAVCSGRDVCCSVDSFSNELNNDRSDVELDIFRAVSSSAQ